MASNASRAPASVAVAAAVRMRRERRRRRASPGGSAPASSRCARRRCTGTAVRPMRSRSAQQQRRAAGAAAAEHDGNARRRRRRCRRAPPARAARATDAPESSSRRSPVMPQVTACRCRGARAVSIASGYPASAWRTTPRPGSQVSTRCEFLVRLAGAVGDDHHAGVQRVADADAAAVMHRHPGGAGRGVEQRVQDRPVGDRVAAVAHAFGLAVGRGDRSGVEMIAADHDRRLDHAAPDEIVDAPGRSARARRSRARRCAPAVPGTRRARAPAGSSGTAPRRRRTSRARASSVAAMSAGSPESAAQRNGPLPSQKSGRMYSGTKPGMSNASATPALLAPARGCCCRSRRSTAPRALQREHRADVHGHRRHRRAHVLVRIRCAERVGFARATGRSGT